jgi:hypothetical protein
MSRTGLQRDARFGQGLRHQRSDLFKQLRRRGVKNNSRHPAPEPVTEQKSKTLVLKSKTPVPRPATLRFRSLAACFQKPDSRGNLLQLAEKI